MVMHEDEHAIIEAMLRKVIGNDECFGMLVSSDRPESERAEDRLVLARFLERMERQFDLRVNGHTQGPRIGRSKTEVALTQQGNTRASS